LIDSHAQGKTADRNPGGLRYRSPTTLPLLRKEKPQDLKGESCATGSGARTASLIDSHAQGKAADRNPGGLRYRSPTTLPLLRKEKPQDLKGESCATDSGARTASLIDSHARGKAADRNPGGLRYATGRRRRSLYSEKKSRKI